MTKNAYPKLRNVYMRIANHYVESYQHGREIAINLIDSKNLRFLKGGGVTRKQGEKRLMQDSD